MSEYNKHYIKNIKKAIKDDKLVLFVGAGISMESGLPSWNDIIGVFLNELNIEKDSRNLDYLKIAQMYKDEYGSQQYLERINEIFSIHKNAIPNHYHNLIAKINPKHVITTNYDSLLERSLNSGIKKYEVIIEDKDIPYSLGNNYIIKMHGDLSTDFVFKEEDYLNYEENYRMISSIIKSIISNNTVLFIGYSLSDPNFHEIYRYIQKTLGNHARKSYLFLTNDISQAEKSYYMNKGLNVVNSSEPNISSDKFVITSKFLESLIDNKSESVTNENQLYNNLSFLDLLYFVPYSALQKYSGLKMLVDFSSAKDINKSCNFKISNNLQLVTFLKEKTMFNDFLNLSEKDIFQEDFKANPYLSEAYQYYIESKWDLATEKFRMEANAAFDRNDYITFLIAEFNIYRLLRGKEKIEISNGKFDGEEFDEIVIKLLESTKNNDKKIINYLKDEVFNFNILYHNYYRISYLCDKIINEKILIEGGGSTWNSILLQLEGEFQTLKNFIDINCLCISHYKEFKKMVTKYFEAYLTAFEIGKLELDEDAYASSVITKLDDNILMNIVPYIENKDLRILLKKFDNKWIPYTEEGYNYITDQIEINLINLNKNFMIETENNLKRSLITLSYSKEQNLEKLIYIIQNIPLNYLHIFNYEIKLLLKRLLNYIETKELNQEIKDKIASEMEKLLNELFSNNRLDNFYSCRSILIIIENIFIVLEFNKLKIDKLYMEFIRCNVEEELDDFIQYKEIVYLFYSMFNEKTKGVLKQLVTKIEQRGTESDLEFLISLMIHSDYIYEKKDIIIDFLKSKPKKNEVIEGVRIYPNVKYTVFLNHIYNLYAKDYFNKNDVEKTGVTNEHIGLIPEMDWLYFEIKEKNILSQLTKNRSYKNIKDTFCRTKEDLEVLSNWIIMRYETENYSNGIN